MLTETWCNFYTKEVALSCVEKFRAKINMIFLDGTVYTHRKDPCKAKISFVDGRITEESLLWTCVSVCVCYLESYVCVFEGAHSCEGRRSRLDISH